jgi:hypothetical protein
LRHLPKTSNPQLEPAQRQHITQAQWPIVINPFAVKLHARQRAVILDVHRPRPFQQAGMLARDTPGWQNNITGRVTSYQGR